MQALLSRERMLSHRAASSSTPGLVHAGSTSARPVASWPCPLRHSSRRGACVVRAAAAGDSNGKVAREAPQSAYSPTAHTSIDEDQVVTTFIAETLLPTRHGKFRLRGYKHSTDGGKTFTEPTAIVAGAVEGMEDVPVRVHDACFTSEVLGSLKCDCAEQLALALEMIQKDPPGIVIYLQQEGRGIGLANKIAAYSLQEQGLDTVDANRALGLPDDCREYTSVRNMLRDMGVKSVKLITNNPRKINVLTKLGIPVSGRIPCLVEAGAYNAGYLEAKRDRMAHMLPEGDGELNGDFCFWDHSGEPTQVGPDGKSIKNAKSKAQQGAVTSKGPVVALAGGGGRRLNGKEAKEGRGSRSGGGRRREPKQGGSSAGSISGPVLVPAVAPRRREPAIITTAAKGGMDLPAGLAHGDNGRVVPVAAESA